MDVIGNMTKTKISYISTLKWLFLLLTIPSLSQWSAIPQPSFSTYFWWIVYALFLFCLWKLVPPKKEYNPRVIYFWLSFLFIHFFYAIYMAQDYWDWKELINNAMALSVPLCVISLYKPESCTSLLSFWMKYSWIVFLLLVVPFIIDNDAIGKYSAPFTIVFLFFPLIKGKTKIVSILVFMAVMLFSLDDRSDSIKIIICLFLAFISRLSFVKRNEWLLKFGRFLLFFSPIIFVLLAITGTFNVLSFDTYINNPDGYTVKNGKGDDENLLEDTRTILYEEAIVSAISNNYVIQGRSISRGYDSPFFAYFYDTDQYSGRYGERRAAEALIVSLFTYFGVIGIVIYFIIFWIVTKKAIYESNNVYIKVLGLYLCFRWLWFWIEDFVRFDLNTLTLWIMIAICLSPYWRKMDNKEFERVIGEL